jgi:diguanylate cyclase (GGDEF)-like protein
MNRSITIRVRHDRNHAPRPMLSDSADTPTTRGAADRREWVLLIEDSSFQAEMLAGMLRTGGLDFAIEIASSLAEARRALDLRARPACVLLDLTLSDAAGLDGVTEMCYLAPESPLVVVTADEDEARAIKAVQLGAQDYLIKGRIDAKLLGRSVRYAIERKRGELELARHALHDPLTGLPNRTLFADRLQLAIAQSDRRDTMLGVLFCDLDGFKAVNDTQGHAAGDRILRVAAGRLLASVRPGDTVARYGGDEFTIVSAELAREEDAVGIAKRIRAAISAPFPLPGGEVTISTSVGIVLVSGLSHRPADVIETADHAMYRAKRAGSEYELVRM